MHNPLKQIDVKEIELPETVFIRDIENRVLQLIVLQSIKQIEGVEPLEGTLFDSLLGDDGIRGIHVHQDQKNHSINVRAEINVAYGVPIPDKAEEIQNKILLDLSRLTSLHVSAVHVIFKSLISQKSRSDHEAADEKQSRVAKAPTPSECFDEVF